MHLIVSLLFTPFVHFLIYHCSARTSTRSQGRREKRIRGCATRTIELGARATGPEAGYHHTASAGDWMKESMKLRVEDLTG